MAHAIVVVVGDDIRGETDRSVDSLYLSSSSLYWSFQVSPSDHLCLMMSLGLCECCVYGLILSLLVEMRARQEVGR